MSQLKFFVAHEGQQMGPFVIEDINTKIQSRELNVSDYLFDEATADWVMIVAYPAFAEFVQFAKPVQPPKSDDKKLSLEAPEWFILKGQNRFGPYSYFDIVKLLQSRSLFEYDYAWNPKLETWHLIAELEEFKAEKIKELKASSHPELTEVFFRRRHARASYGASLIVHNNSKLWKGKSLQISPGGAGIELESGELKLGQTINVHFKPGDDVPPFNSKCEVVNVRSIENNKVIYGVKFLELPQQTQEYIAQFTDKKARTA